MDERRLTGVLVVLVNQRRVGKEPWPCRLNRRRRITDERRLTGVLVLRHVQCAPSRQSSSRRRQRPTRLATLTGRAPRGPRTPRFARWATALSTRPSIRPLSSTPHQRARPIGINTKSRMFHVEHPQIPGCLSRDPATTSLLRVRHAHCMTKPQTRAPHGTYCSFTISRWLHLPSDRIRLHRTTVRKTAPRSALANRPRPHLRQTR